MSRALRQRLARLEAKRPERKPLIMVVSEWDRLSPSARAELERDPTVEVIVIDTGVPRASDETPCEA